MSQTPPPAGPPGPPYPGQPGPPQYGGQPPYGQQPPYGGAPQQSAPYGMPPMQGNPYQQGPPQGTNGLAIASLILGIFGMILISVILGFIALRQIKERRQNGRGLAIAGLALSGAWVLLFGIGIVAAIVSEDEPDRDASGQVTTPTNVKPTDLKVGDCVESLQEDNEVRGLKLVPCSGPNGGEVYAVFELPAGKWPGLTAVQTAAETGCSDRWDALKRTEEKDSDIFYLHPIQSGWSLGDRGTTCLVVPAK